MVRNPPALSFYEVIDESFLCACSVYAPDVPVPARPAGIFSASNAFLTRAVLKSVQLIVRDAKRYRRISCCSCEPCKENSSPIQPLAARHAHTGSVLRPAHSSLTSRMFVLMSIGIVVARLYSNSSQVRVGLETPAKFHTTLHNTTWNHADLSSKRRLPTVTLLRALKNALTMLLY